MTETTGALRALPTPTRAGKTGIASRRKAPDPWGASRASTATLTAAIQQLVEPTSALDWASISALGRIVTTLDERPIRSIITGRRRLVTGSYASRKARRAMPHESMNELAFLQLCEVETEVVDYRAQPFRFEFVLDGRLRTYIADCARLLANGTVEVVEIKSDRRALREPDYALKLQAVAQMCDRLGWRFRTVVRDELLLPPAWRANVLLVQSKRFAQHDTAHRHVAIDALERAAGEASLGSLAAALGEPRRGMAIAMALMVARIIDIDLRMPISTDSLVRAPQGLLTCEGGAK